MKLVLWILLFFLWSHEGTCGDGVLFTKHPANQTVSQGNAARLGCAVQGVTEPDIVWMKDGEKLFSTDQMFITLGEQHWETYHSVKSVQQQDAGQYWCEVEFHGLTFSSERAWITVEGVPHFVQEPQDVATFPNVPFNLTCVAVGPPEPVEVLWWVGGVQEGEAGPSPSVLHVKGVNNSVKFYCEAKNTRGISVSRTGTVHIKVLPAAPVGLQVQKMVDNNVTLSWRPGFTGHSELSTCILQLSRRAVRRWELPQQEVLVPPHLQVLSGLRSHSNYSFRVSCVNEVGASPFSPWLHFQTPESVKYVPSTAAELAVSSPLLAAPLHVELSVFSPAFKPPGPESSVSFTAARSFNRTCAELHESTLDSLGINADLKNKLQDVLIPERLLTLGHMLGKVNGSDPLVSQ
ncbi:tyrosine-protein kinase receptor TYRO3-like [Micropterus dolomieu]|uniref:tyrosine-protein kinase receptor TYRO3-like n=1 Tax=Micropterus dolomieu TaxID=147949 RepID=UPI001E8D6671|nr:tyrosine-protein kinase receptor TYRO3-like [Micropterus dolomieu]